MTTAAGIWNTANAPNATAASPLDNSAAAPNATSSSSTISANDFLTLLVTEMKNQDPTSATDPNQYVNQLVSVNSLQQLIQINQTLSLALMGGTTTTPSTAPAANAGLDSHLSGSAPSAGAADSPAGVPPSSPTTSGNLGIPAANPAAQRVAQAFTARAHLN